MAGPEVPPEPGARCALCQQWSTDSMLRFDHTRGAERVRLEITVCESCGSRLEKHLKRAIPKRLFEFAETGGRGRRRGTGGTP